VRVRAQLASLAAKGKIDAPYTLSPEESARWKKAAEPVAEAWAKAVPNGPAILAGFREETAKLAAEAK
jgi:hypothetical protein